MINRVVLVGRLTKDIELKKTQSGTSVVSFTLACNRKYKQEGQPEADFINCQAWSKVADLMAQYCHKGMLVGIEGRIQTRNYTDREGKKIYITEVIVESISFLESRQRSESNDTYNQSSQYNYSPQAEDTGGYDGIDISSDDLPF